VVYLVSWRDTDSAPLQVIVDDSAQYGSSCVRHRDKCLVHQVRRADCFERSETVVAGQEHKQGLLDEKTERQLRENKIRNNKSGAILQDAF